MKPHPIWASLQLSPDYLTSKANWLAEQRHLHCSTALFFRDAGKLLVLSLTDYALSNLAFFMAILGVERALKRHYQNEETPFKELLQKAVSDGHIHDAIFDRIDPLSKDLLKLVDKDSKRLSHSHKLVCLLPALRNRFFHGEYLLMPEFVLLTLQLRQIADVLQTKDVLPRR